jgi:hypothetical protein
MSDEPPRDDSCRISRISINRTAAGFLWTADVFDLRSDRVAELVSALDKMVADIQASEEQWKNPTWRDGFMRGVAASIRREVPSVDVRSLR